jgi:hypothetical protein
MKIHGPGNIKFIVHMVCVFSAVGIGVLCMTSVERVFKTLTSVGVNGHPLLSHLHPDLCRNYIV